MNQVYSKLGGIMLVGVFAFVLLTVPGERAMCNARVAQWVSEYQAAPEFVKSPSSYIGETEKNLGRGALSLFEGCYKYEEYASEAEKSQADEKLPSDTKDTEDTNSEKVSEDTKTTTKRTSSVGGRRAELDHVGAYN